MKKFVLGVLLSALLVLAPLFTHAIAALERQKTNTQD